MRSVVIIGAGQAGGWVAKTLRDRRYDGRIVLVGDEPYPPYERPPLSKDILLGTRDAESTLIWSKQQLAELEIEMLLQTRVRCIDRKQKSVALSNGDLLSYDRLVLTTGSRPRRLVAEGTELAGILYLRGIDDAYELSRSLSVASKVVVIGGGWIGLEVAAIAARKGASVTVLEAAAQLCGRVVPAQVASHIQRRHETHGVRIRLNVTAVQFCGGERVESVLLSDGSQLSCDLVVVGIGAIPNTELADECGIATQNGILVDSKGRTSDPDIFAAGDVSNQPGVDGARLRLESWHNAQNQSIATAKAVLGEQVQYSEVPYFWSDQGDDKIQIVGAIPADSDVVGRGSIENYRFTYLFLKHRRLVGAVVFNNTQELAVARRLIQRSSELGPEALCTAPSLAMLLNNK